MQTVCSFNTTQKSPHLITFVSFIIDINECNSEELASEHVRYEHNCHADANCTNAKGSFYCTCHTGYSGDGVTCVGKEERLTII